MRAIAKLTGMTAIALLTIFGNAAVAQCDKDCLATSRDVIVVAQIIQGDSKDKKQ